MGVVGPNCAEARGSPCGVPETGNKVEGKKSEGQFVAEKVLQGVRIQPLQIYLDRSQATVAEWVTVRPILDVCARYTGYKVGGKLQ